METVNHCGVHAPHRPSRRKALLLGTALASSLIALPMLTATPAAAQAMCPQGNGPTPIQIVNPGMAIVCVNTETRINPTGDAIDLQTNGANQFITLDNSGNLAATDNAGFANGIYTDTDGNNSRIVINNRGAITTNASLDGYGIYAGTGGADSSILIANEGPIRVIAGRDIYGIEVQIYGLRSDTVVLNNGGMTLTAGRRAHGIYVHNDGDYDAAGRDGATVRIENSGDISLTAVTDANGIYATSDVNEAGTATTIINSGALTIVAGRDGYGIYAYTNGVNSPISIDNSGDITVRAGEDAYGVYAELDANGAGSLSINNSGDIQANAQSESRGIFARTNGINSPISIMNSADIAAASAGGAAAGIAAGSFGAGSPITIVNSGNVSAQGTVFGLLLNPIATDVGIGAASYGGGVISVVNSGNVSSNGAFGVGIGALSIVPGASVGVVNSGIVSGTAIGVGLLGNGPMMITNLAGGAISGGFAGAINAKGAGFASISNAGLVTGFVDLTDQADLFVNQAGGVFQAQGTSLFNGGNDLFTNQDGAVVDTANNPGADENVAFIGLETFQNFGTISLLDGAPGDLFTISNTPGGTDLNYVAGSFLAVDVSFAQRQSDIFRIDGNVAGVTDVVVNAIDAPPDTLLADGITVVQVRGAVDPSAFRLANGPIDTGFFNYDLFFEGRDGAGDPFDEFELRSFPGAGAQLLPQLVTAAQDIWHQTSDTWFDRSADLRTQLWRNGGSVAGVPGAMYLGGGSAKDGAVVEQGGLSPAVWARVSHGELEQDGSAQTNAFGRSFSFNLDRELYIIDVQSGVDFALQGVMNPSDVLLLSVFGGGVSANLQYDQLDRRRFDYDGGQVGVAATYLSGGLFVDALFNAQFLEVDPNALGFAESLDSNAYGFRIDSGYRFGMGSGGLFLEPLLTLAYVNSDLDGFSFAGNTVSFQDEGSLRGRVGLRAGTSLFIESVRFEPFVIASYWGELSDDDNRATLVSSGTRFGFRDEREDGWGEVSLGTNTFLAGNNALSAFSKIDIIFGEDTEGYIAQGGFRVQW